MTTPPTTPSDAPAWAVSLFNQLRTDISELGKKIDNLGTRVAAVEQYTSYVDNKVTRTQVNSSFRDTFEVRISGIPQELLVDTSSLNGVVEKVLTAIECSHAARFVYKTRFFTPKNGTASAAPINMVAVQFTCSVARDDVLASGRKLKDKTAGEIFGTGGGSRVFINPIHPTPIYKLGAASRAAAHRLNYPPPVVRHNGVFMRRSFDSELIPITFDSELQNLTANPPPNAQPRNSQ